MTGFAKPPSLSAARAMRDAGIDAMAALDGAVAQAIEGLTADEAREVKLALGHTMSAVMDRMINPAVGAYPELAPDEATWRAVARAGAARRAG